jgi:hypothetical protein
MRKYKWSVPTVSWRIGETTMVEQDPFIEKLVVSQAHEVPCWYRDPRDIRAPLALWDRDR